MTREDADTLREKTITVMQEALRQIEEKQEPCEDAISRKAAIDRFSCVDPDGTFVYCSSIIKSLKSLTPVTPIRPKGEWLPFDRVWDLCSECGEVKEPKKLWNYCPRCGTNMQEDNNADRD